MTVTTIYYNHRPALEYDFRARFGFGVDRLDRQELAWSELTALVEGLMNDHTSHTFASAAGWAYVPSPEEVAFYDELDVKLAMNRGTNQPRPPRTKRPWEQTKVEAYAKPTSAESRDRRARLAERLGIDSS